MTTFLTVTTPDKPAADTSMSSYSQLVLVPRQTISDASSALSSSQDPVFTTSGLPSESSGKAKTTTAPILRTIDGVVYFRTSMPALDVVGIPVTTVRQGDPVRPIAIWNETQAHGYEVSGTVGQWAALGVLAGFGLLFLVLSLCNSTAFIRRKIHDSFASSSPSKKISKGGSNGFVNTKSHNTHDKRRKGSVIPLTDMRGVSSVSEGVRRGLSDVTTDTTNSTTRNPITHTTMGTAKGDGRSRRLSTYTPLPLAHLGNAESYDGPGFEGSGTENRASRYYGDGDGREVGK
ncbi:hypothetical protein E2P81_ATG10877 [Venturia nashicola]|nr:hypothetical protein E2P81_ATG10877 [Venturia nashicola]